MRVTAVWRLQHVADCSRHRSGLRIQDDWNTVRLSSNHPPIMDAVGDSVQDIADAPRAGHDTDQKAWAALEIVQQAADVKRIQIAYEIRPAPPVLGADALQLQQVL